MLKRKTTGSIVCPRCGKLISANAKECMYCGKKNPGLWGFGVNFQKLFGNTLGVVSLITGACVFLYVVSLLIDPLAIFRPRGFFDILAPSTKALDEMGMTGAYAVSQGRWWTVITAIYLHGSLLHILFNMLWLRQLGVMVDNLFGSARTFLIFTVSGVLGFILSNTMGIMITIGASGSIFGLLGALVFYGRSRGGHFGTAIYRQVGSWAIVLFLLGFMMPAVNNFAHAGGFIGGYLSAMILGYSEMKRENATHVLLALIALALTVVAFLLEFIA